MQVRRYRLPTFLVVAAVALMLAIPGVASPPEITVRDSTRIFEGVDNPCAPSNDPIDIEVTFTSREILRHGVRRITHANFEVTGEDQWSGRGMDAGVQLGYPETVQGETVRWQFVLTNSETGQKFRWFVHGHWNAIAGKWAGVDDPEGGVLKCVRP
jgi:hypothetical protein